MIVKLFIMRMLRVVNIFRNGTDVICMHSWLPWAPVGMSRYHICPSYDYKFSSCAHPHDRDTSTNLIQIHKNRVLFASYGYDENSLDVTDFFDSTTVDTSLHIPKGTLTALIPSTLAFWWTVMKNPFTSILLAWKYVATKKPIEIRIVTSDLRISKYVDPSQHVNPWM